MLPIYLKLDDATTLVVGGGEVALRKTQRLLRSGARVEILSPKLCTGLSELAQKQLLTWHQRAWSEGELGDYRLVYACTDDNDLNHRIADVARQQNILVNVADDPDYCDFYTPSIVDREPLQIAISSGGASPILARLLRARLESLIPARFGHLAELLGSYRERVKARYPDSDSRRRFWEQLMHSEVAENLFAGSLEQVGNAIDEALQESEAPPARGEVYLVGAGPGDPDLLTFRALRLMQQADVVLYDRLVAPAILDRVRRDAERIHVGKKQHLHTMPQEDINRLLAKLAGEGKKVLRLKGGDPFIFGRGGEEIEHLAEQGIPFQVVPGITAAAGCAAYAGIPLTHRDHAQSCVFITGHLKDDRINLDWESLARSNQTIVVYMGLIAAPLISRELIRHGLPASTPVAMVEKGSTAEQRVLESTVANMAEDLERQPLQPPTLLIIGTVVTLRNKLAWFD